MKRTYIYIYTRQFTVLFFFFSLLLAKYKALCSYLHSLCGRLASLLLSFSFFSHTYEPQTIPIGASLFSSSLLSDCGPTGQHHNKNKNTAFRLSIKQVDIQTLLSFFFLTQNDVNLLGIDTRRRKKNSRKRCRTITKNILMCP